MILLLLLFFTACSASVNANVGIYNYTGAANDNILEIGEHLFAPRVFDIIYNPNRYAGKIIRYEGMFEAFPATGGGYHYLVFRYTDGCCRPNKIVGFELIVDELLDFDNNAWVEVVGVLEEYSNWGETFIVVRVISITEMPERGAEFVPGFGF